MGLILGILTLVVLALLWEWLLAAGSPTHWPGIGRGEPRGSQRTRRAPPQRPGLLEKVTRLRF